MIDFTYYEKIWPVECWMELSPEFAAKLDDAQKAEAIDVTRAALLELCNLHGTQERFKELTSSPLFDPNATFVHDENLRARPGKNPSIYRIPLVSMMYNNYGTSMKQGRLGSILPDGLKFPNGESVKDPNESGALRQPLYASVFNEFWNLKALLTHPDINPNLVAPKQYQYYLEYHEADDHVTFSPRGFGTAFAESPLDSTFSILDSTNNVNFADVEWRKKTKKQCQEAIADFVDAGARMSEAGMEVCNKNKALKQKMDTIYSRISNIITGEEGGITAQDIKHAYAIDRLGEVFLAAHEDEELAKEILTTSHDLPKWLYTEVHAALSLLETGIGPGWVGTTEADRASNKKGEKEPD